MTAAETGVGAAGLMSRSLSESDLSELCEAPSPQELLAASSPRPLSPSSGREGHLEDRTRRRPTDGSLKEGGEGGEGSQRASQGLKKKPALPPKSKRVLQQQHMSGKSQWLVYVGPPLL